MHHEQVPKVQRIAKGLAPFLSEGYRLLVQTECLSFIVQNAIMLLKEVSSQYQAAGQLEAHDNPMAYSELFQYHS